MSDTNGTTGVHYPTLELGGKLYIIKFTRGSFLYRLSKSGTNLSDLSAANKNFSAVIDVLHAALLGQYEGSAEDLAELILNEEKTIEVGTAITEALKKVFPPTQTVAAGTAEIQAAPVQ